MIAKRTGILFVMIALLALAGCSQSEQTPQTNQDIPDQTQTTPTQTVTVNGQQISQEEILNAQQQLSMQSGQEASIEQAQQLAIQQVLLQQEVENRGLSVSQEEAVQEIESQLSAQGLTLEEYQEQVGEQMYQETLANAQQQLGVQRLLDSLDFEEVTQNQTRTFYEQNPEQFEFGNETVSYEEAQEDIENFLVQQNQQLALQELLQGLANNATIE